jgi:TetR/AcrR family fatty acid metabolism transcriptional regulator
MAEQTDKKEAGRRKILKAAEKLFAKGGFHGTEVSEIARLAGVAKGTVYNHFDTKEEILVSVIEEGLDELDEMMKSGIVQSENPLEQIKSGLEIYCKFLENHKPIFKIVSSNQVEIRLEFKDRIHKKIFQRMYHLEDKLETAIKTGNIKPIDSYIASTCMIGMVDHVFFRSLAEGKEISIDHIVEQINTIYLEGILN